MTRYPALIDGAAGAYGVTFPDLPGIVAMGTAPGDALAGAGEALRDYAIEAQEHDEEIVAPTAIEDVHVPPGSALVSVPLN